MKNTIMSIALAFTLFVNSLSATWALDAAPESSTVAEESSETNDSLGEVVESSEELNAANSTHTYPEDDNSIGEFSEFGKIAEAIKTQLNNENEKFTVNLSMDTEFISQYREVTWPAVKEKILAEKGMEEDDNLPDERSDSELMEQIILESLFYNVEKTEIKEDQTEESVLRGKILINEGQDVSEDLKKDFKVISAEAEEIEPETIGEYFYTSLRFTIEYEQDADGKSDESSSEIKEETEEKAEEATTQEKAAETTTQAKAEETTKSEVASSSRKISTFGLVRAGAPATNVTINFITADFVSGARKESGKYVWTPVNPSSDHMFVFRVNYSISGAGDIAENGFQITIPKRILKDRNGNYADSFTLSVPRKDNKVDDTDPGNEYAYRESGSNIIVYNCKEISAAQNGYFDIGYSTTKETYNYMDMSESDPFLASLSVSGSTASSNEIPITINTQAEIYSTQKYYPSLYREWQSSWGTKPADADDYYYLVWMIGSYISTPTQNYNITLEDTVSSTQGSVDLVGYKMSGASSYSANNTATNSHIDGYHYDYVLTRHLIADFENLDPYRIDNKITATLEPVDGIDPETKAVSSRSFQWSAPKFSDNIPTGNFNIEKYGTENWRSKFGYYWDYASYELDKLQNKSLTSLDNLKYYVEATGYPYPWTLEKDKTEEDPEAYGKNPVTYTVTDDTLFLVDEGDPDFGSEEYEPPEDKVPLAKEDYDFEYLTYKVSMSDGIFNDFDQKFDVTTHTVNDQDILTFYIKTNDEWKLAGTVNLGTGAVDINDSHVKSLTTDRIDFNEGVDGYRIETTNAYWNTTFNIYPYVSLKLTDAVSEKIKDKDVVILKNVDNLLVTYDKDFDGDASDELVNISKVIGDRIRRVEKNSSLQKNVVSNSNNIQKKYYDVGWSISQEEIMTSGRGESAYVYQNGGTFYDLLPAGAALVGETVSVETEDGMLKSSAYTYETTANYNNSGRTLLTVKIKPQAQHYRVYFHTKHPWESIKDYGESVLNPVAYETGNDEIYAGYPDNGGNLPDPEKQLMTDLDKGTNAPRFLYAKCSHQINALTAAISGLDKKVMTADDSDWSYETMTEPDGIYMYRLRFANNASSRSKEMIFFDSLENYKVDGVTGSDWHGTLQSIDLTQLKLKGIDPVVYLSATENLDIEAHHDISDSSVWVKMEDFGDISQAKAIAIDMSKKTDGADFILPRGESLSAVLYMKTPSTVAEDATRYPITYNNVYVADTVIDSDGGEDSYLIHQDYTTVKYRITGKFSLEKVSEEDNDEKIEGISFRLSGTSDFGTEINIIKETDQDGMIDFNKIEKGSYILQEYGGDPDWQEDHTEYQVVVHGDRSVTIDGVDYTGSTITITNKPRIHGDVSFVKKDLLKTTKTLKGAKFGA